MADFLRGRSFRVRVGDKLPDQRRVMAGNPQRSFLGPILYNIFVSDVPSPPERRLLLSYTDDNLLAFSGPRASSACRTVNAYLERLHRYFSDWKLELNVGKSVAVVFGGRPSTVYPNFKGYMTGDELIRICEKIKYFGVVFDFSFSLYP